MPNNMHKVFSFESGIYQGFKTDESSNISISSKHFKDGKHSLKWDFEKDSSIHLSTSIGYTPFKEGSKSQARDTFSIWIYNENPIKDKIIFEFGRENHVDCWFEFGLNYKGWRTAWVMFERDMKGLPRSDMNELIIKAPQNVKSGTLYFDQIILSTPVDPRHPTRDYQVPFVNIQADTRANSHWLSLYLFSQLEPKSCSFDDITDDRKEEFELMAKRYNNFIFKKQNVTQKEMEYVLQKFKSYNINRTQDTITGNSVDLFQYYDIYPDDIKQNLKLLSKSMNFRQCIEFIYDIACKYKSTDNSHYKESLKTIFIDLIDHLYDQGWAEGSSQGTVHHLGYSLRYLYPAVFLMRNVLREAGILKRTQRMISWYSGVGRVFSVDKDKVIESNMDILNTTVQGMFVSILLIDDLPLKSYYMKKFSEWITYSLLPKPGLLGPFKDDGCGYHHCNHYPAYTLGGIEGVTAILYFLSGTFYKISQKAHETLRKVVLSMRLYCNKYQWLVSLSARHPKGKGVHAQLNVSPFKYMALAGTPDAKEPIDRKVAAAYLRLTDNCDDDEISMKFKKMGIGAEKDPNGHWTMNHAVLSLHRRDNWLVGVRGHSKYIWGNETYLSNNLYGRYITYGQVQIMSQGSPVNNADSGFVQEGWDWNRWPGTTTVHLPFDMLRSNVRNVDTFSGFEEMLISDESYAGGVSIEGKNGMFAMKLHEHPKYDGSHHARKSVFFFDNRIICLGSNIENENVDYPTETTLFQNHLSEISEPIWVNSLEKVYGLDYFKIFDCREDFWIVDNKENGYYIPAGYKVSISRSTQESKAQDTGKDTQNNFATAWIEHGRAPKNQSYEYMIVVKSNPDEMKNLTKKMSTFETRLYTVLQKDRYAHIVKDNESDTIGYAVFEANDNIRQGAVIGVDTPSMIMTKQIDDKLILSICDPDLRLYSGIDKDQYDENGNRIEVSIYSRKWRNVESKSNVLTLTLEGKWKFDENAKEYKIVYSDNKKTVIEFECKDAKPIEILLNKANA